MSYRKPRSKLKEMGHYQIQLNESESWQYETDPNYRYYVSERAAILIADNWRASKVEIIGNNAYGPTILHTFKYRDT